MQGGLWGFGHEGGQAEAIRSRFADAMLVVVPPSVEGDEVLLKAILPVTDVMAAGYRAAVVAGVHPGDTVIVIGDGAVGLCGTLAARRLGAERIVVTTRGAEAISEVLEFTKEGGHAVLECVGTEEILN